MEDDSYTINVNTKDDMAEPILTCEELRKEFLVGEQKINVLKGISHNFYENTELIVSMFKNLKQSYNTKFIIVTHDEQLMQSVDQRIRIKDGELYEA